MDEGGFLNPSDNKRLIILHIVIFGPVLFD